MSSKAPFTVIASPGGLGGGNGPFWAAVNLGLFREHGVSVTVDHLGGGSVVLARALAAGTIHFGNMGASALVHGNLEGADLVCVMGGVHKLVFQIVTLPEVRDVADLRGRTLATDHGNTSDVLWHWFLPQHGLRPGEDVQLLELPSQSLQMEALRRGQVHGMTLSPAGSTYLEKEGFKVLVDFPRLDVDFQLGCVVSTRRFVEAHPEETLRYLSGYVAAIRLYKGDRELGLRTLRGYTGIDDQGVLETTYETFTRTFQDWPYPGMEGFETVVRTIAQLDERAAGRTAAEFMDLQFLDRLRSQGLFTEGQGA